MIDQINETLRALLYRSAGIPEEVDVRFDMPTRQWIDSLVRPTISFFLLGVEENTDLRETGMQTVRGSGRAEKRMPPRRFDLRYMVSAPTTSAEDEHLLLWRALVTLLKHPQFPPEVLTEELRVLDPPLAGRVEKTEMGPNLLDVWSGLEAPPRPALLYVVTVPVELDFAFQAPLVLTRTARYASMPGGPIVAIGVHIGGIVRRRDGSAVPGASVSLAGRGASAVTDALGRFVLAGVPEGKISLAVRPPGGDVREYTIEVPEGTYDLTVD